MERKINVSLSCLIQIQISLYNECVTMKDLIQKRITDYGNIKKKKTFCLQLVLVIYFVESVPTGCSSGWIESRRYCASTGKIGHIQ